MAHRPITPLRLKEISGVFAHGLKSPSTTFTLNRILVEDAKAAIDGLIEAENPKQRTLPWAVEDHPTFDKLVSAISRRVFANSAFAYRGESRQWESLKAKIDRRHQLGTMDYDHKPVAADLRETILLEQFVTGFRRVADPLETALLQTGSGALYVMQHYGAPTRMLDWSMSPWIAMYFACCEHFDEDGFIWCFDWNEAMHSASKIVDDKLIHSLYSCKVEDWFTTVRSLPSVICCYTGRENIARIFAQRGLFTFATRMESDHAKMIADAVDESKRSLIRVRAELKLDLLRLLFSMNIRAATMFPDREGIARDVADGGRHQDIHTPLVRAEILRAHAADHGLTWPA